MRDAIVLANGRRFALLPLGGMPDGCQRFGFGDVADFTERAT